MNGIIIVIIVAIIGIIKGSRSNPDAKKAAKPSDLKKEIQKRKTLLAKLAPPLELRNKAGGLSFSEISPLKGTLNIIKTSKGGLSRPE